MPNFSIEENILSENKQKISTLFLIAGIDEAGRGAWAGPVVSASVVLDKNKIDPRIDDSKKLSPVLREKLFDFICKNAISYGIGICSEKDIDKINILEATKYSMVKAVKKMPRQPNFLLLDAVTLSEEMTKLPQKKIIKGDSLSYSIAAASILAKVTRDNLMKKYDEQYPEYNFAAHKGYGTPTHKKALAHYGPCPIHRFSYKPIQKLIDVNTK